jgi:hypothetical protein
LISSRILTLGKVPNVTDVRAEKKRKLINPFANYHPFAVLICPHTYSFQLVLPFCIYLIGTRFCECVKICFGYRFAYALYGTSNFIFAYSSYAILAGILIYILYYYAKRNPELVDKTVQALIGKISGRRVVVTTLRYFVAIIFSFKYLPASLFLLLLVLIPEFIPDRYFGWNTP